MKEYKYRGFSEPIKVDDNGNITYKNRPVERYFHGYNVVGVGSGFSITQLTKQHYIEQMLKIDTEIEQEEYRNAHKEDFEKLATVEESLNYFFFLLDETVMV